MITVSGHLKNVYEISDTTITVPVKEDVPTSDLLPDKKKRTRYVAPSTSVLAILGEKEIQLVVGRHVSEQTLKNVLVFGIKNKKLLRTLKCEILSSLRQVDEMVVLCNEVLNQSGSLSELEYLRNFIIPEEN